MVFPCKCRGYILPKLGLHHDLKRRYNRQMDQACATHQKVLEQIADSCRSVDRAPDSVSLLAVSKRQSAIAIRELAACGQKAFGENYLQEAKDKIETLGDLNLEWHFIGPLQSNKTGAVASLFDWVHTVDREKIARRLNAQRPAELDPLNICLQINISDEPSKNGMTAAALPQMLAIIPELTRLRLRGLMALPAPTPHIIEQRDAFRRIRELYEDTIGSEIDTLSIGTSSDYQAAIAEGATMVRIGTALFGERD